MLRARSQAQTGPQGLARRNATPLEAGVAWPGPRNGLGLGPGRRPLRREIAGGPGRGRAIRHDSDALACAPAPGGLCRGLRALQRNWWMLSRRGRRRVLGARCARPARRQRRHRRGLARRRLLADGRRHRRAVGFQEPVLRVLPLSRVRHPFRLDAVLEPLSLWRAPQHRRSAVADLRAGVRAVGAVRPGAFDARVRPDASTPICSSAVWRWARSAGAPAGRRRPACWRRWCSCSAPARRAGCSTPASS